MKKCRFMVSVIGLPIKDICEDLFKLVGLSWVNEIKESKLGNFRTFTYIFEIFDVDLMNKRKELLDQINSDSRFLMPFVECGKWNTLYIFKRFAL